MGWIGSRDFNLALTTAVFHTMLQESMTMMLRMMGMMRLSDGVTLSGWDYMRCFGAAFSSHHRMYHACSQLSVHNINNAVQHCFLAHFSLSPSTLARSMRRRGNF